MNGTCGRFNLRGHGRVKGTVVALFLATATGAFSGDPPSVTRNWRSAFAGEEAWIGRALTLPPALGARPPDRGRRVAVTAPEYTGTDVYHMLYLPLDWTRDWQESGKTWPVIVEFTGNHYPAAGSTGKVEDAALGFGISGGQFIWATLPFVDTERSANALTWWGDAEASVDYAKRNVPRLCEQFGGDPNAVFLCGFSRGAIATSFIGLHDDEIARMWRGFIAHDHYDGVQEWQATRWGTPLSSYRQAAARRLARIQERPVLISQQGGTDATAAFLKTIVELDAFTFLDVDTERILGPFPNASAVHPHTDRWLLKDSPERRKVWAWLAAVLAAPTPAVPSPAD